MAASLLPRFIRIYLLLALIAALVVEPAASADLLPSTVHRGDRIGTSRSAMPAERRVVPGGATLISYDADQKAPQPLQTAQAPAATSAPRAEFVRPDTLPDEPRSEPLPQPQMFAPGQQRLPLLGEPRVSGTTPRPTPQTIAQFARFVEQQLIEPENALTLVENRTYVLRFKQPPFRVQIDDQVVAADLITERELSLAARAPNQNNQNQNQRMQGPRSTVLNLWFNDPESPDRQRVLSYLIQVVNDPETRERQERAFKALEEEVNRLFPNSHVKLNLVGNRLAVSGEAKDIVEAAQLLQIVASNAPLNSNVEPLNVANLNVVVPANTDGGLQNVNVGDPASGGNAGAQGLLEQIAQRNPNIINLIRVSGEQQVMLRVTLAEVNRTAARAIGVNFNVTGDSGLSFASLPGFDGILGAANGPGALRVDPVSLAARGGNVLVNRSDLQLAVNALSTMGMARTLAEPNLVALNGQTATFRAGTDVAVQNLAGGQGVVLSGFAQVFAGITLNFTPQITDRDRVRLQMVAQIGTLAGQIAAANNNNNGPNITQRTVQTVVELRDGQTLAVAGLLSTNYNNTANGVPFLGDIPMLGRLFRSDRTSTTENELMIIITPELVHPLDCHEQQPLPGADMFEPSDVEFFVKGRLESLRSEDYRDGARTSWDRMQAYRRCEQKYIIGPHGHSDGKY